jgi:hypothetical protein
MCHFNFTISYPIPGLTPVSEALKLWLALMQRGRRRPWLQGCFAPIACDDDRTGGFDQAVTYTHFTRTGGFPEFRFHN